MIISNRARFDSSNNFAKAAGEANYHTSGASHNDIDDASRIHDTIPGVPSASEEYDDDGFAPDDTDRGW